MFSHLMSRIAVVRACGPLRHQLSEEATCTMSKEKGQRAPQELSVSFSVARGVSSEEGKCLSVEGDDGRTFWRGMATGSAPGQQQMSVKENLYGHILADVAQANTAP